MIGNDIVDLAQAASDSNWHRKGYLDKIFSPEERFMISSGIYPDLMVWLLWSMKEAAYKADPCKTKLRVFAPVKLRCNNVIIHENGATGNVVCEDMCYFTRSTFTSEYVHTIAAITLQDLDQISVKIEHYTTGYRTSNPASVSHHGRYLALAYK